MDCLNDTPPTTEPDASAWLDRVAWNEHGLVPAITQSAATQRVLTLAWMNREALAATVESGWATYWSRSRAALWRKGETSGHRQKVVAVYLDCDHDSVLLQVEQIGGVACHTGRESCFYQRYDNRGWHTQAPVLVDPQRMYPAHD